MTDREIIKMPYAVFCKILAIIIARYFYYIAIIFLVLKGLDQAIDFLLETSPFGMLKLGIFIVVISPFVGFFYGCSLELSKIIAKKLK